MDYHKEADKLVTEIKKLQIEKNLRKLDYELVKARTVEKTQEVQTEVENEWNSDSTKRKWIGTPTEQQEIAKRLAEDPDMIKDRADIEAMTRQEMTLNLDIFEKQELLNNMRVFGGRLK